MFHGFLCAKTLYLTTGDVQVGVLRDDYVVSFIFRQSLTPFKMVTWLVLLLVLLPNMAYLFSMGVKENQKQC